ncbi:MAG: N-acetylmuramoyl-L-alanine amidase [Bacteroidales bacterium]|nr:N-acetylmuramoyl-L-alanine amidase [Bacteroidales bacterium]
MIKKIALTLSAIALASVTVSAQIAEEFQPACDSISVLLKEKTSVTSFLKIDKVMKRGCVYDFYFGPSLSDYPLKAGDVDWLKKELKELAPEEYEDIKVGNIYTRNLNAKELIMPELGNDGQPNSKLFRTCDNRGKEKRFITREESLAYPKGLDGRYIALWQSHGRYFEAKLDRWEWQRATLLQTVEDTYTQSYVVPFLIPMLENAGAYCMTPRERDPQPWEVICDNDPMFSEERDGYTRRAGTYGEKGSWSDAGVGFADAKKAYYGTDNPFTMGTVRQAACIPSKKAKLYKSEAVWTPDIPERGNYAVYISYKSLENSTTAAHYTVKHLGGESNFIVNQKIGGGTWIYLGTFEFAKGTEGCVTLDNVIPDGEKVSSKSVITADGVKIGGGIGKIARGLDTTPLEEWETSGYPSFVEGAVYWMQWAGTDSTITHKFDKDYTNDYGTRGAWTSMMAGGSRVNPKEEGKGIPFDLSFAFHTDAGTTPNDSIVGTLSIYTLMADDSRVLPNGEDRLQARELADFVQTQIVNDVRSEYEPLWSRRQLRDGNYSESRTTGVPAMLLEHLSHQNFADMKFGLNPAYRFTVSRAIYKGMLKYLSNRYGCPYVVQPLPVNTFAAVLDGNKVRLSWKETADAAEPTATADGYILYTRIDDGGWDNGTVIGNTLSKEIEIQPGHIYSYKIEAYNQGGKSFPSEILSAGIPAASKGKILVVNNFDRLSSPAWFDGKDRAGFDNSLDSGVPYINEINFIGEQYNFRRTLPWMDDDNAGFGSSWVDDAGKVVPGNTFDYPSVHGKYILEAGYSFYSASNEAFEENPGIADGAFAADIICGKQVTTNLGTGNMPDRYQVFPVKLQEAIRNYTSDGGNILISGSKIATDVWDMIYPVQIDSTYRANTQEFVQSVLGYKWLTTYGTRYARTKMHKTELFKPQNIGGIAYQQAKFGKTYSVETADGLLPASENAAGFLRYEDTNINAGIVYIGNGYKAASIGFPIETITNEEKAAELVHELLKFFSE